MIERHVPYFLTLLACCTPTAPATRVLVLDAVRRDCGQAGGFDACKSAPAASAASRPLADGSG